MWAPWSLHSGFKSKSSTCEILTRQSKPGSRPSQCTGRRFVTSGFRCPWGRDPQKHVKNKERKPLGLLSAVRSCPLGLSETFCRHDRLAPADRSSRIRPFFHQAPLIKEETQSQTWGSQATVLLGRDPTLTEPGDRSGGVRKTNSGDHLCGRPGSQSG